MATFPGPRPNPDDMTPNDCIFSYEVTLGFIQHRYPAAAASLEKGENPRPDDKYEVLEYVDDAELVMLVVGKSPATTDRVRQPQLRGRSTARRDHARPQPRRDVYGHRPA